VLPVDAFEVDLTSLNIGMGKQDEPQGVIAYLPEQTRQGACFLSH
jgi:hypothetical protein